MYTTIGGSTGTLGQHVGEMLTAICSFLKRVLSVNGMCLRTNLPRDDGVMYLEDEYAVRSTATDFYDDYEIDNADEEVVDGRNRRQLRGNNNRRLNNSRPECRVGDPFNNCPSGETCWRRRVGSSLTGNGICVRNGACLPSNVFAAWRSVSRMEDDCCSGRVWQHRRYGANGRTSTVQGCY